ncbi:Glucose/galactose transporter [Psilocybe cubensis]|uniref:MFS general substrate transporter n=2 Tax=Psilocybe cubensis TaxID=181762 RepID=A0A8H8CP72_PSICU|nr:Glucose/galactose transporter [Psilocybe cubensis]KAH9485255.1 Glucose/galactose transporter [Psilocybe cubensis]
MSPASTPGPIPLTGSQLSRGRWAFAFALVTSLFFTGVCVWGTAQVSDGGGSIPMTFILQLLDVLNAHFQKVFGISKTQSTLLQLAYFGAYVVFSPFAGIFMRRYGYKSGIHLGLTLYSLGAVFFWPSAKFAKYGAFVGCTFVIGCGLATLEVAANSYIAVLGTPKYAAARLNFSQGFQGVASFSGPLIASRWFFRGANATKLDTVQWVYLAVAGLGLVLNILFYFCDLPEIEEEAIIYQIQEGDDEIKVESFWKQYRCLFGFVAQTAYVGAQVGVASLAVNFLVEQNIGIDSSRAITGKAGVGCLFALFFFESICYPCIFTLGTKNLGIHTKQGSGLIVMGVGGGAWYPPAQASVADRISTRRSYLVPFSGYLAMSIYAFGLVIDQTRKDGFRFRTIEESNWRERTLPEDADKDVTEMGKDEKQHSSTSVQDVKVISDDLNKN